LVGTGPGGRHLLTQRFTFDRQRNVYVCPAGKLLKTTGSIGDDHVLQYLASKRDCDACPLKPQCCPNMLSRKVTRDINEDARDLARALMGTPEFDRSRDERKKVEMRFAHLKTHHRFEGMRLRGLSGAREEFHLAAIVQNLKTLGIRNQPPPPNRPAMRCVSIRSAQRQQALDALATAPVLRKCSNREPRPIIDHFINDIDPNRSLRAPSRRRGPRTQDGRPAHVISG
jgi:hypothetical protein